uniref:aldehyde dehydrogenase family protein n=1 Tax=Candidatus Allofournierella excrementavium TaxID=2838591 RepID=UPI003AF6D93D
MDIEQIVKRQRDFFATGATLPVSARVDALKRLQANIRAAEKDLQAAMKQDLNKSGFESYMAEIGMVLDEVGHAVKKLPGWAKPKRARTPMSQFAAKSFILSEPYGVTLVMAPWNYPFLLSMDPVIGAVAAGNCVVLKPSAYAPATSAAMAKLIADTFDPGWVTVVEGGRKENSALLDQRFDFIFFTGGVTVGKLVMEKASHWLTPVILELGGKSPVLIDRTADIPLTARRLAFGKVLNAGQTCVAPDYVLVDRAVKDQLVEELKKQFAAMLGPDPLHNPDYVRIINRKHFERITGLLEGEVILAGGQSRADEVSGWIEPTLVEGTA